MAEASDYGGLGNLDEEGKTPVVYNVYQQQAQTPDMDLSNLQNVYGTAAMPVFNWVQTIKTGQRTYTPGNSFDEDMLEKYNELLSESQKADLGLPTAQELVVGIAAPIAQRAGQQAVSAIYDPYLTGEPLTKMGQGVASTFGQLPGKEVSSLISDFDPATLGEGQTFFPELSGENIARRTGMSDTFAELGTDANTTGIYKGATVDAAQNRVNYRDFQADAPNAQNFDQSGFQGTRVDQAGRVTGRPTDVPGAIPTAKPDDYLTGVADRFTSRQSFAQAGMAGAVGFGINLAAGMKPKEAAKSAGAAAIGAYIGQALIPIPGLGATIGGTVGQILGGRVICNELQRQGIMSRDQVVLDYRFTRDHLTPQHVNGYHIWSVWMVRQMRKGKFVGFWKHVAGHRANEIAYIYGERDKPDYLGKIYRKVLEPACWLIGRFCKKTDWSILYKSKEV
jgi:hypothetical protein